MDGINQIRKINVIWAKLYSVVFTQQMKRKKKKVEENTL